MKIHVEFVRYEVLACSVECPYANCSADSGVAPTATHTSPPNYEEDTSHKPTHAILRLSGSKSVILCTILRLVCTVHYVTKL